MPDSLFAPEFQAAYDAAEPGHPSPADWRDQPIYFLMVDRFNNPRHTPVHAPFDDPRFDGYQGGSLEGVRSALGYLKRLGAGAVWLSPVLKNLPFSASYHGYGIHDFCERSRGSRPTLRRRTTNSGPWSTPHIPKGSTSSSTSS